MPQIGQMWSQFYPPTPVFTQNECPDLLEKVFIVTGGYSGVGFELVKILYSKNATVYVAGRSKSKGEDAIKIIRMEAPSSKGRVEFLFLDLGDLSTIRKSADDFLSQEKRLDVLWNNAGVMTPPAGSKTKQNYEMQLGTNCLGPFLFTQLLSHILIETAALSSPNSVRVCWTGSLMAELSVPDGVINFDDINGKKGTSQTVLYGQSKAGNIFLGWEFARRMKDKGLISVTLNPGNLKSPLQRHATRMQNAFNGILLHPAIFGAYTELFAGLSPEIGSELSGSYIIPWGRVAKLKKQLADGLRGKSEGGTGAAKRFYEWCEEETKEYL